MRAEGFTLVEMLVVLTIVGLIGGALSLDVRNRFPGLRLDSARAAAEEELRDRQAEALSQNRETSFSLAEIKHPGEGLRGRRLNRIGRVEVQIQGPDPAHRDTLRFLPGGWSPGGRMILKDAGRQVVLRIDWPLGLVHVETAR